MAVLQLQHDLKHACLPCFLLLFCCYFETRVLPCNPGWPQLCHPLASVSWVLGWQLGITRLRCLFTLTYQLKLPGKIIGWCPGHSEVIKCPRSHCLAPECLSILSFSLGPETRITNGITSDWKGSEQWRRQLPVGRDSQQNGRKIYVRYLSDMGLCPEDIDN